MKHFGTILLLWALPFFATAQTNTPSGKVVWWGRDDFFRNQHSTHTNGLLEDGDEFLTNAVAVTAIINAGLTLKNDGTVLSFGMAWSAVTDVPAGLSNVVSISAQSTFFWAIKRDGTVTNWGGDDQDNPGKAKILAGLSNITQVVWAGYRNYLALQKDGTVVGFRFDDPQALVQKIKVNGQLLNHVTAMAAMGYSPLLLKDDGTVFSLSYQTPGQPPVEPQYEIHGDVLYEDLGAESRYLPYQYTAADPVVIQGQPLTNVISLASGPGHALALKKDGTIAAWGNNTYNVATIPPGISNVIMIAANDNESLALKRDGTVVAWGNNDGGATSVPAGLSNVVAIASAGDFNLAITTGNVPTSVFIQPHGRLEKMEQDADLVFKGRVLSDVAISNSNSAFPSWGNPHATRFNVISVLKGNPQTTLLTFLHITTGPMAWGGGAEPSLCLFDVGRNYIVFAKGLDKSDYLFPAQTNATKRPDEFRQLYEDDITRTLDDRPLASQPIKEVHWLEFNLLLNDSNPSNQLYAIDKLDGLCLRGDQYEEPWRSGDFKRQRVLTALLPLLTNSSDAVAIRAINCFATSSNAAVQLKPFADALAAVAVGNYSPARHLAAINSLSGLGTEMVSNSLAQLLTDTHKDIRVGAVRLLPRFPDGLAEPALRERADDPSAEVRAVVADVIGDVKYERLLPTLAKLFAEPVGKDPLIKPLTMQNLKDGQRWSNGGDVHTSAGLALVKFAPYQVSSILKTNLDDEGFHINFVAKLAQGNPEPWLPELVSILEARKKYVDDFLKLPNDDPRRYSDPQADRILIGTYTKCWEDIRLFLMKQPPEILAGGKYDYFMDILDEMVRPTPGCPGCMVEETKWLYQLYSNKHLTQRAANLRQQYDKTESWWFDDFDKRGEAAGIDTLSF